MTEDTKILLEAIERSTKTVMNINEVAAYTGYSIHIIRKLMCQHEIPFYKPRGKNSFFRRSEIDDWLCRNRQETTTAEEDRAAAEEALEEYKNS